MRFQYRAARADGHIERGVMLAADQAELGRRLARHGLTLLAARPRARAARWRRVNRRELVHLFFYLEQLTRAGAPLLDALHETRDALDAPILRDAVAMLADAVRSGRLETKAICRTFSDCTTAPRNGMISGCYPLDRYYVDKPEAQWFVAEWSAPPDAPLDDPAAFAQANPSAGYLPGMTIAGLMQTAAEAKNM